MTVLSNIEFRALYYYLDQELDKICKEKGILKPTTKKAKFGYGNSRDNKLINLWSEMSQHQGVQAYIDNYNKKHKNKKKDINPTQFANCLKEVEEGKEYIRLEKKYEHIYFIFLGCDDKEAFLKKFPLVVKESRYDGFYYNSGADKEVKGFSLRIEKSVDNSLHAYLKGFHVQQENKELHGTLRHHNQCWFIDVKADDLYASIWIHVSNSELKNPEKLIEAGFLFGILNAVSTLGYPLSVECILKKCNPETNKSPVNPSDQPPGIIYQSPDIYIKRYLILMRNSFHVKVDESYYYNSVENLKAGVYEVNLIRDMHGGKTMPKVYRILAYNSDGFTQSKLTIANDYTTYIEMPDRNYKCFIAISRFHSLRFLISSYESDGVTLSVFTAINSKKTQPKSKPKGTKFKIIEGAFCNTAQDGIKPIGNQFVMIEDDTEKFEPQNFKKTDLNAMRRDEKLEVLVDELIRVGKDLTNMYSVKEE